MGVYKIIGLLIYVNGYYTKQKKLLFRKCLTVSYYKPEKKRKKIKNIVLFVEK